MRCAGALDHLLDRERARGALLARLHLANERVSVAPLVVVIVKHRILGALLQERRAPRAAIAGQRHTDSGGGRLAVSS